MLANLNILIVEDEALVAMDLELAAENAGAEQVFLATSCEEAMTLIEQEWIDVAILDIALPDGKSLDTAKLLTRRGTSIVFHSGHADPEHIKDDFPQAEICTKPCGHDEVMAAVAAALGHHRKRSRGGSLHTDV
jgi:DNA-binding response OmpR family regulator